MNEEIKSIFGEKLVVGNEEIPVAHLRYRGSSKRFVTWTIIKEDPNVSANDEVLYSVITVDFDIFSDCNYLDIIKEIKKKMKNNDWVWVEDSPEMYEEDTELYHRTCTFEKERYIEWQE
jgi:hypothetical protein